MYYNILNIYKILAIKLMTVLTPSDISTILDYGRPFLYGSSEYNKLLKLCYVIKIFK